MLKTVEGEEKHCTVRVKDLAQSEVGSHMMTNYDFARIFYVNMLVKGFARI